MAAAVPSAAPWRRPSRGRGQGSSSPGARASTLEACRERHRRSGDAARSMRPTRPRSRRTSPRSSPSAGPVKVMFNAIDWGDTQGAVLTEMDLERLLRPVRTAMTTWFVDRHRDGAAHGENGGGAIVGITANAAREAYSHVGGFGIACAAVEHYLRQLAVENGPYGVRVHLGALAGLAGHAGRARGVASSAPTKRDARSRRSRRSSARTRRCAGSRRSRRSPTRGAARVGSCGGNDGDGRQRDRRRAGRLARRRASFRRRG